MSVYICPRANVLDWAAEGIFLSGKASRASGAYRKLRSRSNTESELPVAGVDSRRAFLRGSNMECGITEFNNRTSARLLSGSRDQLQNTESRNNNRTTVSLHCEVQRRRRADGGEARVPSRVPSAAVQ